MVVHPDITPNVAFAALFLFWFAFFFNSSSLPDLLSEIKLTVGEVSHDLTQLVRTFRWVNCITDFTVSSTGKSVNQCSLIWSKNKQLLPGQRSPRKPPYNPLKAWKLHGSVQSVKRYNTCTRLRVWEKTQRIRNRLGKSATDKNPQASVGQICKMFQYQYYWR